MGGLIQPDPFIQTLLNTQNYNRYSYVLNNPMSYTDPSGYFYNPLKKVGRSAIRGAVKIFGADVVNFVGSVVSTYYGGAWGTAAWTYEFNRAMGASSSGALRNAAIAGASAWAFSQIGSYYQGQSAAANTTGTYNFGGNWLSSGQIAGQITAHAVVGGVTSSLQGGKFGHGFFSAGVTKGLGTPLMDASFAQNVVGGTVISATIGGTASVIAGGKFANGAVTGAMQALYNHYSRPSLTGGLSPEEYLERNWDSGQLSFDLQVGNDYVQFDGSKLSGSYSMLAGPGFSIDTDGKIIFDLGAGFSSRYAGARGSVFADSTGRAGMQGHASLGPLRATASYSSNVASNWHHLKVVISEVLYADANRGPNIRHSK